jgi:beta-phosphoglucomutase-like phosphatase (HAD superfamily)
MFQIQAVIFDLDGLMIDSESLSMQAWKELLADFGVELEYEVGRSSLQILGLNSNTRYSSKRSGWTLTHLQFC